MAPEIIEEIEELCQMKHNAMPFQYVFFFFFFQIWKGYYRSFLQSREKSLTWCLIVRNVSASIFSEGYFHLFGFLFF